MPAMMLRRALPPLRATRDAERDCAILRSSCAFARAIRCAIFHAMHMPLHAAFAASFDASLQSRCYFRLFRCLFFIFAPAIRRFDLLMPPRRRFDAD